MKVSLIKASAASQFKDYKQYQGSPPQNIYSVAAATPADIDYELVDETAGESADLNGDAELVVLFMSTPDAWRGYELAAECRARGKTVIIGGLHASFLPEEAQQHADALLLGEAEGAWVELLDDYQQGVLKPRYENSAPVDMATLNPYPHARVDPARYNGMSTVLVSRGCKFQCNYCTIPGFFPTLRHRPVGAVVDEIRQSGLQYVELHADNLIADQDYALELLTALKPLGIQWAGEATINIAQNETLLQAAAESGCVYLVVGLETACQAALKNAGKGFVRIDRVKENIARLHEVGIGVDSAMLFGFDEHDEHIFQDTLDWVDEVELDVCHAVIVTPFPGTALFRRMESEGRLLHRDWRLYDCDHVVFQPQQMSAEQLLRGRDWFHQKHNSLLRSMKRNWRQPAALRLMNSGYA